MNGTNTRDEQFTALYQATVDDIYQYIYWRTGFDSAVAEDLTQDIFVDVLRGLDRFKGLCSEKTWVFRIAQNKLNSYYRRQYAAPSVSAELDDDAVSPIDDPSQDIDRAIDTAVHREVVRQVLDALPPHYKTTLLLKYMDGQSVRQIARMAGKSPKSTESQLQRARTAFIKTYQSLVNKEESAV